MVVVDAILRFASLALVYNRTRRPASGWKSTQTPRPWEVEPDGERQSVSYIIPTRKACSAGIVGRHCSFVLFL